MSVVAPGGTLGILGGGQLGRMAALAARPMGYRVVVFDPTENPPAAQVADGQIRAAFEDLDALAKFARGVDVATLEWESLPLESVTWLADRVTLRPSPQVLAICQDRLAEKRFLRHTGAPVVAFAPVGSPGDLPSACATVAFPALLKTCRGGYDGRGQVTVEEEGNRFVGKAADDHDALGRAADREATLARAHAALGGVPCILEQRVSLARELSILVARDLAGAIVTYPVAENSHVGGILETSCVPATLSPPAAGRIDEIARAIARALGLVGVLCVELFETTDGDLLVNELAPRPHNSGHWSIEACLTGQFEQQVRITAGAPAGTPELLRPAAIANLLGDLWTGGEPRWAPLLEHPDLKLHLYGKSSPRPGRKMGHLTALAASAREARDQVLTARSLLQRR